MKSWDTQCEVCGRTVFMFGCSVCGMRKLKLLEVENLLPDRIVPIDRWRPITGTILSTGRGTFSFPDPVKVYVEGREEDVEKISVTIRRIVDGKRFELVATKPGPWETYTMTKELI